MNEMTFSMERDDGAKVLVSLSPDSTLSDVLEAFERFLLGMGYSFDGRVDIVEELADKEN